MSGSKASRRVAPADVSSPPAFTEAPAGFPGEDVASASVLREHYGIPPEECLELEEGTCWCRRIEPAGWRESGAPASEEKESNAPAASTGESQEVESSRIPIVVCSGGTGAGMFYKQFATDLAASYQGPVIIFDRFNIGLSDRLDGKAAAVRRTKAGEAEGVGASGASEASGKGQGKEASAGGRGRGRGAACYNNVDLWCRQLVQMLDKLNIPKAHFVGVSLASIIVTHLEASYPHRVARIALISALVGGFAAPMKKRFSKYKCIFTKLCCCCWRSMATKVFRKKMVPKLYDRCDHQAEEGADPDGLPIAKAMYRVKGTTRALVDQFLGDPIYAYQMKGMHHFMKGLAERGVPLYLRTYSEDNEMDRPALDAAFEALKKQSGAYVEEDREERETRGERVSETKGDREIK